MNEMVERVARGLCRKHVERGLARDWTASLRTGQVTEAEYGRLVDANWPAHADDARAAIEAMRESLLTQLAVQAEVFGPATDADHLLTRVRQILDTSPDLEYAMIDAALAEEPK